MVFIASRLLFVTLLLQATKESTESREHTTPRPDTSMHHREFCLRIPDDSHWTSSEPGTQLPTKSNRPTEQPTEPTNQGSSPLNLIPQLPKPERPDQENYNPVVPKIAPSPVHGERFHGCRCKNKNKMKLPTETSEVIRQSKLYPSKTCASFEYIEFLADGREVCVPPFNSMPSLEDILSWFKLGAKPVTGPKGSPGLPIGSAGSKGPAGSKVESLLELPGGQARPPKDSGTKGSVGLPGGQAGDQNPTTVLPKITQLAPPPFTLKEQLDELNSDSITDEGLCKTCDLLMINLNDVDPKAVESLDVNIQSYSCPPLIYIYQKDKRKFCSNLSLGRVLQKLEILEHREDSEDAARKAIVDGCRCKEREKRYPSETSRVKKISIWPPSEKCSSTEFIVTLEGGREVCTTAFNPPEVQMSYDESLEKKLLVELLFSNAGLQPDSVLQPPALRCVCRPPSSWNNIETKDVESINVELSPGCARFIYVTLKDKTEFCIDSFQPRFQDLLLKQHVQDE
ncbi:uncharacterized protein PAE49_021604 isoform 1-T1 [Odontesthes bonariensis]|uniref:uncharacterized protein LOC142368882 n=1 Tax=Odontesthes bonariensis TaxID=219752 RepID=UPI003F58EB4D